VIESKNPAKENPQWNILRICENCALLVNYINPEAADAIGIGQAEYSRMESGRRSVRHHKKLIVNVYGVKPNAIIEREKQDDSGLRCTINCLFTAFSFKIQKCLIIATI
jgi:hypothetical protein